MGRFVISSGDPLMV
ncbi:hypothetical protein LINPERHAP1_LOCUS31499 [Linum perenne]